jgi:hypothetical protein
MLAQYAHTFIHVVDSISFNPKEQTEPMFMVQSSAHQGVFYVKPRTNDAVSYNKDFSKGTPVAINNGTLVNHTWGAWIELINFGPQKQIVLSASMMPFEKLENIPQISCVQCLSENPTAYWGEKKSFCYSALT